MGSEGISFTGVAVLLNSDSEGKCVQAVKDRNRYTRRSKGMSNREIQCLQKQRDDGFEGDTGAVCPLQIAEAAYQPHVWWNAKDVLSNAMKQANEPLSRMDFSVEGAIDRASNMFDTALTCATFESNFYPGWAHTRKCMHPEWPSKVNSIIHLCWKAGESKDLGKVKISVDGMFARLDELRLQKGIRLSELPLAGKIRAVYQTIGSEPHAPRTAGYKHGRLQEGDGEPISRQKKARVTYEELDLDINLSKWKKKELEAYLTHHKHCKDREQP